jgi:arginine decarboxylase-like protein
MKEKEFEKKFGAYIMAPTYYSIDDKGNVDIDEDAMQETFDAQLKKIVESVEAYLKGGKK